MMHMQKTTICKNILLKLFIQAFKVLDVLGFLSTCLHV